MARPITEQANPNTAQLDQLEPREILERILEEDARVDGSHVRPGEALRD